MEAEGGDGKFLVCFCLLMHRVEVKRSVAILPCNSMGVKFCTQTPIGGCKGQVVVSMLSEVRAWGVFTMSRGWV